MSEEEIKNEKPNQILEIINEILDFNKKNYKTKIGFETKSINFKPKA